MAHDIKNGAAKEGARASLPRVLGIWDVIAIVVGGVIGSGIFLVPKSIALAVQSPILVLGVWVVGGMLSFFGALTFAELGAAMPEAGGMYVFLREAYGPLLSFLFGWTLFLVIDSGAIATLTVAFASRYLPYFFKMTPLAVKVVSVLFIVFLGAVNYVGVRAGANLQNVLTIIKTAALVGISGAIFIFGKGNASNFVNPAPGSFNMSLLGSFGIALVASLWAFKGWEGSTYSAGEIKRPERNLPLGILGGSLIVLVLYIITNLAYLYMLPVDAIAKSDRIASDAISLAVGPAGGGAHRLHHPLLHHGGREPEHPLLAPRLLCYGKGWAFLQEDRRSPSEIPDAAHLDHRHLHLEHHSQPLLRDLRTTLHLRHLRPVDLLRPDRGRRHRPPEETP